jgi:ribosome-associated translation inhibitor RaiA
MENVSIEKERILQERPLIQNITCKGINYEVTISNGSYNLRLKVNSDDGRFWEKNIYETELPSLVCPYLSEMNKLQEHLRTKIESSAVELAVQTNQLLAFKYPLEIEDDTKFYYFYLEPKKDELSFTPCDITLFTMDINRNIQECSKQQVDAINTLKENISKEQVYLKEPLKAIEDSINKLAEDGISHTNALLESVAGLTQNSGSINQGIDKAVIGPIINECLSKQIEPFFKAINERLAKLEEIVERLSSNVYSHSTKVSNEIEEVKVSLVSTAESIRRINIEEKMTKAINSVRSELFTQLDKLTERQIQSNKEQFNNVLTTIKESNLIEKRINSINGNKVRMTFNNAGFTGFTVVDKILKDDIYIERLEVEKDTDVLEGIKLGASIVDGVYKFTIQITEHHNNNIFIGFTDSNIESGPFHAKKESIMYNLKNGSLGVDKANKSHLDINKYDYITVVLDYFKKTIDLYINGKFQSSKDVQLDANSYSPCIDVLTKETAIAILN